MEPSIEYTTNPASSIIVTPCPHCGKAANVYRAARLVGRGRLVWDRNGRLVKPVYDKVDFQPHSDAVRCMFCKKLRRDLLAIGQELRDAG